MMQERENRQMKLHPYTQCSMGRGVAPLQCGTLVFEAIASTRARKHARSCVDRRLRGFEEGRTAGGAASREYDGRQGRTSTTSTLCSTIGSILHTTAKTTKNSKPSNAQSTRPQLLRLCPVHRRRTRRRRRTQGRGGTLHHDSDCGEPATTGAPAGKAQG